MKLHIFIFFIFLFFSFSSIARSLVIQVGQTIHLPIHESEQVKISNGKVISWLDEGYRLRLTGKQAGFTVITAGDKRFSLQVLNSHQQKVYRQFKSLLATMKGLKVQFTNNKIQVTGQLYRWADWEQMNRLAHTHQQKYLLMAQVDNDVKAIAKKKFKALLAMHSQQMPSLKFQPQPTVYRLDGSENKELDHALGLRGIFVKPHEAEQISKQIRLDLSFIEVSQLSSSSLGLSWSGGFQAQLLKTFTDTSNLAIKLNQAVGKGEIQVISENSLVCEINQECQFTDGGEFPVRSSGYASSRVVWKKYGVIFKFFPKLMAQQTIKLKLDYEISHPDAQTMIDDIPGMKIKSLSTFVYTKNNHPIAVTGLSSQRSSSSSEGIAPLQSLPLISKLLGAHGSSQQQHKVILIVKPQIISND